MTGYERPDLAGADVFALHCRRWKRPALEAYFPDSRFTYLPLYLSEGAFVRNWAEVIGKAARPVLLVWGQNAPESAFVFARENSIPLYTLEDGFIRSLVPNAGHSAPFSLTLDSRAPYFDSRHASDLECLLGSYDFRKDSELMERAANGIRMLLGSRLSKYNAPRSSGVSEGLEKKSGPRVLVLGQVEDDASILLGCDRPITNNDAVRLAAAENPGCEIVYKPHPDVVNGVRKRFSDPAEIAGLCRIVTEPIPLPDMLETADRVYTITSLGGFEALLRGIPVTVLGCPFYAGWGLTDDRQPNPRRQRKLSVEELFAGAYLLYPHYFNPVTGDAVGFEECLELAGRWRDEGMPASRLSEAPIPEKPRFALLGPYGLFGWRHLMTGPITWAIRGIGSKADAENFRKNPILFFRELSNPSYRRIGRLLYPFD